MKIYFLTSKLNFEKSGGSVEEFDLMIRTLIKLGHEVIAVTAFSESNAKHHGLPYRVIEERIPRRDLVGIQIGAYRLLKKYEHNADFFHVDGHNFLYGAGFYRRCGGKVPVSAFFNRELGSFPEDASALLDVKKKPLYKKAKAWARWCVEKTIGMWLASAIDLKEFITPQYMRMYRDFGLRGGTWLLLGDPTDFPAIMRENRITEHSYADRLQHDGRLRIFFSSRMAPGKGFDLLLAGFARVKNKDRFTLVLGGDGPEESSIHALTRELGVERHVEFTGWMTREQLYEQFKKADIYAQVGWRKEGASMTLLYAMAFGVPPIVPKDTGMAWQAGEAGTTVPNGDHDALARAIELLADDSHLRTEKSKKCYERLSSDEIFFEKTVLRWLEAMQLIKKSQRN